MYEKLVEAVAELEREHADTLDSPRFLANAPRASVKKSYVYHYVSDPDIYDTSDLGTESVDDLFAQSALQGEPLIQLINEYFSMYSRLRYYDVWHNFPHRWLRGGLTAMARDTEDRCMSRYSSTFAPEDNCAQATGSNSGSR